MSLQLAAERVAGLLMLSGAPVRTPSIGVMQTAARELMSRERPPSGRLAMTYEIPSNAREGHGYTVALYVVSPLTIHTRKTRQVEHRYQVVGASCPCPATVTCHHVVQALIIAERDGVCMAM